MVFSGNLAGTCGKCHPGAGKYFAIGPVHVGTASASEPLVVKWIRLTYWVIIPISALFMFLHQFLDFLKKLRRSAPRVDSGRVVLRMNLHFRIAHWLTMLSFPVLVITGFALKFPDSWWSQPLRLWGGHLAFRGLAHRVAAVILLASLGYHILHLIRVRRDRRAILRNMMPNIEDANTLFKMLAYNLGLTQTRPTFGKFNYAEKIEYLAFLWGTMVMAVSGFTLWFHNFALRYFPKWVSDAATAMHYYEAILATLAILIWHMYTVVFDPDVYPMDPAWLTGNTSADHLRHTRPAYYAELMSREAEGKPEPAHDGEAPDTFPDKPSGPTEAGTS
jgi:cytochrome b subunit of formate dehydrogenase